LPNSVSLAQILKENSLRIGAVSGRAYGKHIDALFKAHNKQLMWISGKDAAKRLRLMFAKAKFDAVIEYSATFISEPEIDVNKLSFHKLDEGGHVVFGYIACANSELGKAVIKMYNELLRQPSNQNDSRIALRGVFWSRSIFCTRNHNIKIKRTLIGGIMAFLMQLVDEIG
jgi:uncharacterized protein (TIGR02285 family)